ncbi:anti-sigma factor domain-containing protein [Fictibacillus iocasae]|uniref:Anti-sigma factor domain-containing protein n=1 Tax=Fictibacillus iocasae TaxID=2715437 RepID=A0ABW2NV54_9BACL
MSKAIIVELNKHHAIVLAEGGSFIKVKRKSDYWTVGQEIDSESLVTASRPILPLFSWKAGFAGAAAVLLLFFQFFYPFTGEQVYASVSMDMEPSIELEINKDLQVINMIAYNTQGEEVLRSLKNWEDKKIAYVTKEIFEISSKSGFVKPHQEVLITTTITEDISYTEEKKLKNHVNSLMQQEAKKQNLEMTSIVLSKKEKMKAEKYGISPGQYAILKAAEEKGQKMNTKDVQNQSLEKIAQKVGPVNELFDDQAPMRKNKQNTGQNNKIEHKNGIPEKEAQVSGHASNDQREKQAVTNEKEIPADKPKQKDSKDNDSSKGKTVEKPEEKNSELLIEKQPAVEKTEENVPQKEMPSERIEEKEQRSEAGSAVVPVVSVEEVSSYASVNNEVDANEMMNLPYNKAS